MEAEVTPGNIHDSAAFDTFFRHLIEHSPEVQAVTADAGYETPWICKQIFDSGRACPALQTTDDKEREPAMARLPWQEYVCDEYRAFLFRKLTLLRAR